MQFRNKTMDSFAANDCKGLNKAWTKKRSGSESEVFDDGWTTPVKKDEQQTPRYKKRKFECGPSQSSAVRRTKLATMCNERLAFSQFRAMNEYLYSHSSTEAQEYMDEAAFEKYHSAYDDIAAKWPVKPIDEVIKWMEQIGSYSKKNGKGFVFADMGCGSKPLIKDYFTKATVHSFGLVSQDANVVKADIAHVPLENNSCDCVVFCLSLMGTNIKDYILEANRILKKGGSLIIAEVSSRYEEESVSVFAKKLETGYGLKMKKEQNMPPNNYFVLMQFAKAKNALDIQYRKELLLKPCIYKPR